MITNLKIAWRNIIRHKSYAAINISGLAAGIAASLLLFMVIRYELSYDKSQPAYNHIYHVAREDHNPDGLSYHEGVPFPAYDAFRLEFPQVTTAAMFNNSNCQVSVLDAAGGIVPDKKFIEGSGIFFSDPQFFSVFQYKWLYGSADVLKDPGTVVLTKKMAEKYFGQWSAAIGGVLRLDNASIVKVSGIIEDVPRNTDFPLAVVASYETLKKYPDTYGYRNDWGNVTSNFQTFMLLPEKVSANSINEQLRKFSDEHYNKNNKAGEKKYNFLRPLSDIHFDKTFGTFGNHVIGKSTLLTLALIGLFIIIMACINFINLSTAQAVGRSKEVGIKKVLGSNRAQLFRQMMGETAIIVSASIILAIGLAYICLPYLKNVTSIRESLGLLTVPNFTFIICVAIIVVLLAGTYPSLILSGFKPILALKNKITSATVGGISIRRGLVVTQFAVSQVLIVGTIVAVTQMNYVHKADLGFNKEAVLTLNSDVDSMVMSKQPALRQELLTIKGVQSVSFSSDMPSSESNNSGNFSYDHRPDEKFDVFRKFADEHFFKTYGLEIIAGRAYGPSDTAREIVINETMVKRLGIKDPKEVLGHEMRIGKNAGREIWCTIVGVVKDFKTNSLREDVKPTLLAERNRRYYYTGIKLETGNLQQTIAAIKKKWDLFYPEFVFEPKFLDQRINDFYGQENQLSLLYKIFAGIAIFISCLGLYGLVSFMAVQKTKEVGVRKVLGASVMNIVYLFSKEFTILILLAFAIAAPIAYFMMSKWLDNFAFKINIGFFVFGLAIIASISIAWITVGYKSVRAALANPIKSLRTE